MIGRLRRRSVVEGITLFGSAAWGRLTDTGDYDLLVVPSTMPVPLRVAITRSTDGSPT